MTLAAASLAACDRSKASSADGAAEEGQATRTAADFDGLPGAYLTVQDKLAHDDIDGLDRDAAALVKEVEKLAGEPGAEAMLIGAGRVGAKDIDTARTAFRNLSLGLLEYMKAHPEAREGLIVIHCPMTFEGEGAPWVQPDGPVMNPYEGSMMLHCGNRVDWTWSPD